MKLPYKYIALFVVLALAAAIAFQAYWLVGLYRSQVRQTRLRIAEVLRMSDYNEMALRIGRMRQDASGPHGMVEVKAGPGLQGQSVMTTTTTVNDSAGRRHMNIQAQVHEVEQPAVDRDAEAPDDDLLQMQNAGQLVRFFQRAIHSGVDGLVQPDYALCDSLLRAGLRAAGLAGPYRLEVVRSGRVDSVAARFGTPGYVPSGRAETYDYAFGMGGGELYRLRMEPVAGWVVRQMTGILLTSLAVLCLLAFAFFYLIRTLLRLKTLEEMTSDFTHNMTHELKTPIAVAYAANDALLHFGGMADEARRTKYLEITREQLARLGGLVERILSMNMELRKEPPLQWEDVELAPLVSSLVEQLRLKADRPVEVQTAIRPDGLCVRADRQCLCHILDNLLDNAVKYSRGEARIRVGARLLPPEAGRRRVEICVSDEGIGIPHSAQRHVFEKFYRVPQGDRHDAKGYGLGLYYVKHLVTRHGGTIGLRSEPGRGTTFTLVF